MKEWPGKGRRGIQKTVAGEKMQNDLVEIGYELGNLFHLVQEGDKQWGLLYVFNVNLPTLSLCQVAGCWEKVC